MTSAVVYVLTKYLETDTGECAAYCAARGYELAAIVKDDYQAALQMLCDTAATVLIVAQPERLTDECTPRTEFASEVHAPPPTLPSAANFTRRRTARLMRPGGAG